MRRKFKTVGYNVLGFIAAAFVAYRLLSAQQPPPSPVQIPNEPQNMQASTQASEFAPVENTEGVASEEQTLARIETLKEILASKNDNDQRLDTDFRDLNETDKQELRKLYHSLASEDRNARGTVVFLLGRNLNSADDIRFLGSVLSEPPCLSLSNCSKATAHPDDRGEDHGGMDDVTLAYPKIVALRSLENLLHEEKAQKFRNEIVEALQAGSESEEKRISDASLIIYKQNRSALKK